MTRKVIGVAPPAAFAKRQRLFQALSDALDVRFVDAAAPQDRPGATVHIGQEPERIDQHTLVLGAGQDTAVSATDVHLSQAEALNEHLRDWIITDDAVHGTASLGDKPGATTLAEVSGLPVWTTQRLDGLRLDRAAIAPDELGRGEMLRSQIVPGRFLGLVPLVAFVRSLHEQHGWHLPPIRASFIMDDPNLHAARYGYIDFAEVAIDAAARGYHLSVATIPLDSWFTSAKTARLFRANPDFLSLMIHGNSHTKHELGDNPSRTPRLQVLAQGLRRIHRLEDRSEITVAKVMAAPHGRCSEESALAMAQLGYEAICISRPFPWLEQPPAEIPLAGWFPGDTFTAIPTIPRMPFTTEPAEIALRAFLGHPIILYGHDYDLGDKPDVLATWAQQVAQLGSVTWASVGEISRNLVSWRSDGETIWIRPHTRLVDLAIPAGIMRLVIEAGGSGYETAFVSDTAGLAVSAPLDGGSAEITLPAGTTSVTVQTAPGVTVDCNDLPSPRWSPWPSTRRMLTEARDRTRPYAQKLRKR